MFDWNIIGYLGVFFASVYRLPQITKIYNNNTSIDDISFSKAVRQSLLHWAYKVNQADYDMWKLKNGY